MSELTKGHPDHEPHPGEGVEMYHELHIGEDADRRDRRNQWNCEAKPGGILLVPVDNHKTYTHTHTSHVVTFTLLYCGN